MFLYKNLLFWKLTTLEEFLFYKFSLALILYNHLENTNNQKTFPKFQQCIFKLTFFISLNYFHWLLNLPFGIMNLKFP